MTQINELQSRLTRALDRIGQTVENYEPGPASVELDALRQQLNAAETALAEAQEARAAAEEQAAVELGASVAEAKAAVEADLAEKVAAAEAARDAAIAEAETEKAAVLAQATAEKDATIAAIRAEAEAALAAAQAETSSLEAPQLETMPAAVVSEGDASAELAALREALDDEKMANAQLEERMRVLRARLDEASAQAAAPAEPQPVIHSVPPEALLALDTELQRLRKANTALSESNAALRQANAQGVGEAHLINKAMLAELESVRAARAADAAEINAVMATLQPLLAEAAAVQEEAS